MEVRQKALEVRRALAEGTGPVDPAKLDVARELVSIGWLNYELHHYEEFAAQAEEAAALTEGLRAAGDPRLALDAEAVRGQAHERLAIYIGPGESDKGLDHLAKAIDSLQRVLAAAPDDRETQLLMAECLMESGGVYAITFLQPTEARDHFNQSVALYDKMAGTDRDSVAAQAELAHVHGSRGNTGRSPRAKWRRRSPTSSGPAPSGGDSSGPTPPTPITGITWVGRRWYSDMSWPRRGGRPRRWRPMTPRRN